MKNLGSKKVILTILLLILALTFTGKVLATGTPDNPLQINITTDPTTNTQTPTTNTQTNVITNMVAPTTNTATSNYLNTNTLPQTGDASDYAIFLLIGISAIIAVYAYKRIKDYNIK